MSRDDNYDRNNAEQCKRALPRAQMRFNKAQRSRSGRSVTSNEPSYFV
jgi:hypothetical protein